MGMTTLLYGMVEEYRLNHSRLNEINDHNEKTISNLNIADSWPPLSKEMFSITKNDEKMDGPNLEYQGRMIHFGACLKSVEYEWESWKVKFERLLKNLYWIQAHVHLKTEYSGIISFEWHIDLKKWNIGEDPIVPIKETDWKFTDINNWGKIPS